MGLFLIPQSLRLSCIPAHEVLELGHDSLSSGFSLPGSLSFAVKRLGYPDGPSDCKQSWLWFSSYCVLS